MAYLGVMCSALTYLLYNYALKTLAASQVTAFLNLVPVAGAAAAVLLLGEHLQPMQLLGGAVILAGVAISTASRPGQRSDTHATRSAGACKPRNRRLACEHALAGRAKKVPGRRAVTHAGPAVDAFYQPGGSGPDGDHYLPTPLPPDPGTPAPSTPGRRSRSSPP